MAAVLELQPPPIRARRVFIENPKTFTHSLSRKQWRDLPLQAIVGPGWLNEPHLVVDERDQLADVELKLAIEQFADQRAWIVRRLGPRPSARDVKQLRYLGGLIRRKHLARVALAVGYTWPGNPPGHIEFAPDA